MSEQAKVQSDDKKVVQEGNVVATNVVQQDGQSDGYATGSNDMSRMLIKLYDGLLSSGKGVVDVSMFGSLNVDIDVKKAMCDLIAYAAETTDSQKVLIKTLTFDLDTIKEEYNQLKLEGDYYAAQRENDFAPAYGQYSDEEKEARVEECKDIIEDCAAAVGVTPRVRETGNVVRAYKHHPSEVIKDFGDLLTHDLEGRKAFTIENMVKLRVVFDILSTLHIRDRHFVHSIIPPTAVQPEQITAALHRGMAMDASKGLMNSYTQPISHIVYTLLQMFEGKLFPKTFWPFTSWVLMTIINVTWVAPIDPCFRTPNNFKPPRF